MRRSFTYCMLDPGYRAKYVLGVWAAIVYTVVAAAIVVGYSRPSKAADPYEKFDQAIVSWNKACKHQVWPHLDNQCMKGADVETIRVIGGPQLPPDMYRDAEEVAPPKAGKPCLSAGKSCVTAILAQGDRV